MCGETLNRKNNHTNGISVFKLVKNEVSKHKNSRWPTAAILF